MVTRLYCLSAVSIFARFHIGFGQVYVANLYSLTSLVSGCIFADKNIGVFSDSWRKPLDPF